MAPSAPALGPHAVLSRGRLCRMYSGASWRFSRQVCAVFILDKVRARHRLAALWRHEPWHCRRRAPPAGPLSIALVKLCHVAQARTTLAPVMFADKFT